MKKWKWKVSDVDEKWNIFEKYDEKRNCMKSESGFFLRNAIKSKGGKLSQHNPTDLPFYCKEGDQKQKASGRDEKWKWNISDCIEKWEWEWNIVGDERQETESFVRKMEEGNTTGDELKFVK